MGTHHRRAFFNERDQANFFKSGYLIKNDVPSSITERLQNLYQCNRGFHLGAFSASMMDPDISYRVRVNNCIAALIGPYLDSLIDSYKGVYYGFAVKQPSLNGALPLHRDISFIDETTASGLSVWMPLVDTNEKNGALEVVPKSHQLFREPRAPGSPFPGTDIEQEIRAKHLRRLNIKAGQMVIMDHATYHSSEPNRSTNERPVVAGVIVPKEMTLQYYHREQLTGKASLECYQVTDNFYQSHTIGLRPQQVNMVERIDEVVTRLTEDDLCRLT